MAKKAREIIKDYSFCKSMVYALQAITGEKTHDILGNLVAEAEKVLVDNKIDISENIGSGWTHEKTARTYIFYPGSKMYLGIYVKFTAERKHSNGWQSSGPLVNKVSYSFKLPQSFVKMKQQEFDDIAVDGMLTDSSFDFSKPTIKRPKTKTEKDNEYREKQELARVKREMKAAAKLAKSGPYSTENKLRL